MLDPITALGVAGNILQFIDFSLKATSKAREIYRSADGALEENTDLEIVIEDIAAVARKLESSDTAQTGNDGLDALCKLCAKAADELLVALRSLKPSRQKSRVKSVRKALKSLWGKKGVEEMKTRLEGYRNELQFHLLVSLKFDIDVESTRSSERFDGLGAHAKAVFAAISEQQESISQAIQTESARSDYRHMQTVATIVMKQDEGCCEVIRSVTDRSDQIIKSAAENGESIHNLISSESLKSDDRHQEMTDIIVAKQDETHTEVMETIQLLNSTSRTEQESTRRELQRLKQTMVQVEEGMKQRDEELRELLVAWSRTNNNKERKVLQEKSNAVTVALCALRTVDESLQNLILGLQAHAKLILNSENFEIWGSKSPPKCWQIMGIRQLDSSNVENTKVHELTAVEPIGSELCTRMEVRMQEHFSTSPQPLSPLPLPPLLLSPLPLPPLPLSPIPLLFAEAERREEIARHGSPKHYTFYHP